MLVLSFSVIPILSRSLHCFHCFENAFLPHCTRGELLEGEDHGLFCEAQPSAEYCPQVVLSENSRSEERTSTSGHWQPRSLLELGRPGHALCTVGIPCLLFLGRKLKPRPEFTWHHECLGLRVYAYNSAWWEYR